MIELAHRSNLEWGSNKKLKIEGYMTFLLAWAVLLMLFLTVAVYRGYKNRLRMRSLSKKMKSVIIKVNELWQRVN